MVDDRVDLPPRLVKQLSALRPARAMGAIAAEWLGIAAVIGLCVAFPNPLTYLFAVVIIGSRQHALGVIGHDASHHRLLPRKWLNDLVGNVLLMWPLFLSVAGYRHFHLAHHQHLNEDGDGNRALWQTHSPDGELVPDWVYPKSWRGLIGEIVRYTFLPFGFRSSAHMVSAMFDKAPRRDQAMQLAFYFAVAALLTLQGWWLEFLLFWLVPLNTWHVTCHYLRTISEHSGVRSTDAAFGETRTTIPRWWESLLFLPRNVGYHIEHHWYPSVPFYSLPRLHRELMKNKRFRANADIAPSFWASILEVTRPREGAPGLA